MMRQVCISLGGYIRVAQIYFFSFKIYLGGMLCLC